MIISVNPHPPAIEFQQLMAHTDQILNGDAIKRPDYYRSRGGNPLEDDVVDALIESAKGTAFAGTIEKISGQQFPDIVAARYYGVEVKSTIDNHWTSTGNSILETTRVSGIERIYMTFGKLGGTPIEFLSRPYEQCLYGIAVTHTPRYLIDMRLKSGETIFDKMGISYDELRKMDNPIAPVAKYYRSQLKKGESLWWTGDSSDETVSATIRLWKNLSPEEKRFHTIFACVNYPEIFGGDYDRYALWLSSQGIVDPHIRDQFSAGGQEEMQLSSGEKVKFPAVYRRIKNNYDLFFNRMSQRDTTTFVDRPSLGFDDVNQRLHMWVERVSRHSTVDYELSMDALNTYFWGTGDTKPIWWRHRVPKESTYQHPSQETTNVIDSLKQIEYEPGQFISLERLNKAGVTEQDINSYCSDVLKFAATVPCFSVTTLAYEGIHSSLDELGFDEFFYVSILKHDVRLLHKQFKKTILFGVDKDRITLIEMVRYLLQKESKIEADRLITLLSEYFGINVSKQEMLSEIKKDEKLYFDSILEYVYKDYETYYQDV